MRVYSVLAILALAAPCTALAEDVQSVLDRYIVWRGGDSFEQLHSFHERGETRLGRLHGSLEQWGTRDGYFRRNSNLGDIPTSEAATSSAAWTTNTSGQIEDLADAGESDRRLTSMAFACVGGNDSKITLLGREEREDRAWDIVRVAFPGNNFYDLFLAPDSGRLLGVRITEDRQTRFVRYGDWRKVRGVRMPFGEVESGSNPVDRERRQFSAVEINIPAPIELFSRPASAKTWRFLGDSHASGWIHFEFFNDNQIFIPATVNGKSVKLILDSGAGMSVLDSAFAKQIGAKSSGTLPVAGVGGQATMSVASALVIQLADLTLQRIRAGVIDLSPISTQLGHPMPFILGKEVFNDLLVDIDFTHHQIAFRDEEGFSPPPGAVRVALGRHADRRSVPLSIEGRAAVPFDFDLGNNGPLIVYPAYRDETQLLAGRRQSLALSAGVGGLIKSKVATVSVISIAGIELPAVTAEFPDAADNAVNSDRTAGNVGLPIFSRFRVLTDYPHDALWLIADAKRLADPFVRDRSGIAVQTGNDRLKILMVAPGSPAERANIKEGSEVVAVDGKQIEAAFAGSTMSQWAHQPPGTVVKLTLADGSVYSLTLEDYY